MLDQFARSCSFCWASKADEWYPHVCNMGNDARCRKEGTWGQTQTYRNNNGNPKTQKHYEKLAPKFPVDLGRSNSAARVSTIGYSRSPSNGWMKELGTSELRRKRYPVAYQFGPKVGGLPTNQGTNWMQFLINWIQLVQLANGLWKIKCWPVHLLFRLLPTTSYIINLGTTFVFCLFAEVLMMHDM